MGKRYFKTEEEAWEYRERMRRRKKRILRRKIRDGCHLLFLCLLLFLTVRLLNLYLKNTSVQGFGVFTAESDDLSAPVSRTSDEIYQFIKEASADSKDYQYILEHYDDYPEEVLSSLINNPEMLDFVTGYPEQESSEDRELTKKEKKNKHPLFLQWDTRWGYDAYGESCIGISGCGPTCLTMVIHMLDKDSELTPADVAQFADVQGYYVEDTGTSWTLMTDGAANYGITGTELSLSQNIMENALDDGKPIICALRAGDFTTGGHFIVIYDYDKHGFQVHDPNSTIRSEKSWTYEELMGQIKNLWAFSKQ